MTSDTRQPVAVIAGGGSGIGRGCALRLAGEGYHAVLVGRDPGRLDAVMAEIAAAGGSAAAFQADVRDFDRLGIVGFFGGLLVPLQALLVARTFGQQFVGRVVGLLSVVVLCALLATPPIFGLIFDLTGDYDAIFIAFAALAVGTMLVVPHIRLHLKAVALESLDGVIADGQILAEPQKG